MIDIKKNLERLKHTIKNRNLNINIDNIIDIREKYINKKIELDKIKNLKNNTNHSQQEKHKEYKIQIKSLESEFELIEKEYNEISLNLPCLLHESVPYGKNSDDNICIKQNGNIIFIKNHYDMNIFNSKTTELIGSRFIILNDKIAKLERALISFMMDHLENNEFIEYSLPSIVNEDTIKCTGHANFDITNMFKIESENKYLIPTSEVLLVALAKDKHFNINELPMKLCAITDCFRKEAGAAGKDTKGLIRLHQFKKCEMVCITEASKSYEMLEYMLNISCNILEKLHIPYRVLNLCSGDIGNKASKCYDIEIPIGGQWREVASISNCEDFQSRRLKAKFNKEYVHTLNGSALAIGRTLASLLECYYNSESNSIKIPSILHKYLSFKEIFLD